MSHGGRRGLKSAKKYHILFEWTLKLKQKVDNRQKILSFSPNEANNNISIIGHVYSGINPLYFTTSMKHRPKFRFNLQFCIQAKCNILEIIRILIEKND